MVTLSLSSECNSCVGDKDVKDVKYVKDVKDVFIVNVAQHDLRDRCAAEKLFQKISRPKPRRFCTRTSVESREQCAPAGHACKIGGTWRASSREPGRPHSGRISTGKSRSRNG